MSISFGVTDRRGYIKRGNNDEEDLERGRNKFDYRCPRDKNHNYCTLSD